MRRKSKVADVVEEGGGVEEANEERCPYPCQGLEGDSVAKSQDAHRKSWNDIE